MTTTTILTDYGIDANTGLVHGVDAHGRCVFAAIPSTLDQVQVSKNWVRFESKNRELVQLNCAGHDVAQRILEVAQDLRLAEYKRAWQLIYPGNKMSVEDWGKIGKQLIERVNAEIKAVVRAENSPSLFVQQVGRIRKERDRKERELGERLCEAIRGLPLSLEELKAKAGAAEPAQPEAELVTVTPVYFYNAVVLKDGNANRIFRHFNGTYIPEDDMPLHGMIPHIQEQIVAKFKAEDWVTTDFVVHVNQLNRLN